MKKVLACFYVVFLLSCSNSYLKEETNIEYIPSTPQERAMFGYDLSEVHDRQVNIKVSAKNEDELNSILSSLGEIGVEKREVQEAFVEGEWFINAKIAGNYPETLKKLREMNQVVYADPNYKVFFADGWKASMTDVLMQPFSLEEGNLDSDIMGEQKEYALAITQALKAYKEFGIGENKVWAGIIDTGTNANHEDLKYLDGTNVVQVLKTAYGAGDKIADISGNSDYEAERGGHGTHCSGTICAVGNNGKGIAGVAWKNVMLASYKGMINGGGDPNKIYNSLKDLVKTVRAKAKTTKQATIPINLSLGAHRAGSMELEYINYVMDNGGLLVVANGNDGQMLAAYPAAYPGVLSVGATGGNDKKIGFSTTGPWTNVCAPGVDIISLSHKSPTEYVYKSGTSMATPFVTGMVAYLLTKKPEFSLCFALSNATKKAIKNVNVGFAIKKNRKPHIREVEKIEVSEAFGADSSKEPTIIKVRGDGLKVAGEGDGVGLYVREVGKDEWIKIKDENILHNTPKDVMFMLNDSVKGGQYDVFIATKYVRMGTYNIGGRLMMCKVRL